MKKVNFTKFRYKNVVMNVYYSSLKTARKAVILAYGLPDSPVHGTEAVVKNFVNKNFLVFAPHYIGTYDSFGRCTIENAVDTILQTIEFVQKGKGKEMWDLKKLSWKIKKIILCGGSFGGSVVLVAGAKSKDINEIIAAAPPVDYRLQGKKYEEENIMEDYYRVKRGWINTWRCDSKYIWKRFHDGKLDINPIDYANILRDKNIFLIHGTRDKAVNIRQSSLLFDKLKQGRGMHKFVKLKGEKHFGLRAFGKIKIFNQAMKWLSDLI